MIKKRFALLISTLFCLFFACQNAPRANEEALEESPSFSSFPSSSDESSPAEETPPLASDVWDTTDVDLGEIDKNRKLIAFTFDDAPAKTLENILAVFAAFNEENPACKASATVFFNGKRFDNQSLQLAHASLALGFELGNHTHSHADLTTLTDEEMQAEIERTDELLERIDGKKRHLLRAPFGKLDERVRTLSQTPIIDWTIDTLDWKNTPAEEIYARVMAEKFSGAIVLMHDGYVRTVSALKRLLPDLRDSGYQVVSVSKMSKAHGCFLRRGSVYIRARKPK